MIGRHDQRRIRSGRLGRIKASSALAGNEPLRAGVRSHIVTPLNRSLRHSASSGAPGSGPGRRAVPEASASSPRTIGVRVDDGPVDNIRLATDDMILTIPIATESSRFRGVSLIEFHFGGEIGDRESERPHDLVRIGVKRFRYGPLRS